MLLRPKSCFDFDGHCISKRNNRPSRKQFRQNLDIVSTGVAMSNLEFAALSKYRSDPFKKPVLIVVLIVV